jgi:hypothetical protein
MISCHGLDYGVEVNVHVGFNRFALYKLSKGTWP